MADPRSQISHLFAELRRRKVIRVGMTYCIVGFAVIEAADVIVETLSFPPPFVAYVIVAIFLGFPIAIVLAWSYDVVPDAESRQLCSEPPADYDIAVNKNSGRTLARVAIAIAVTVVAAVTWYEFRGPAPAAPAPISIQYVDSIAVMPLDNLTGDPAYDHVGGGITEEIIMHLASIPPLKVISRHSVQAAARKGLTIPQLANALNVRHIIEGSIRLHGDNLRISLQHIDAESGAQLWADNFVVAPDEVVERQEDIANDTTTKVVELIPGLTLPEFSTHVELGRGQEAYLSGKRWLGQRTGEGFRHAITDFQQTIALNPGYAPAYADLSSAYSLAMFYRYDVGIDSYALAAQALAFADHSIALDANLAAGYAARGYLGALIGQSAPAVAADFSRAASLQPNAASIPSWRARSLAQLGRFDEAVAEANRAIELDPLSPARQIALAELSLQIGDYNQAISSAQLATALEPRIFRARAIEARALLLSGKAERCARLLLGPHHVLRASCLEASGRSNEAQAIIDKTLADIRSGKLRGDGVTNVIVFEDLAIDFALRGDAGNALFWAARAYAASPAGVEIRNLESALFDKVRDDPDFAHAIAAIRGDLYGRVQRDSRKYR